MTIDQKEIIRVFNNIINSAVKRMIKKEFDKESNPYGQKWTKKKVPNGQLQMVDTGKLKSSFQYSTTGFTTTINNKVSYFEHAADPEKGRMVIPEHGLPDDVKKDIEQNVKSYLNKNAKNILRPGNELKF